MKTHRPPPHALTDRSDADLELDLAVALRIEEFRWVEWNEEGLRRSPLYEPGRFIAHPGDMVGHHYMEARADASLASHPYRRLPHYSSDASLALRAAERAGLFGGKGLHLSCSSAGTWRLHALDGDLHMENGSLPRLLARASLRWIEGASSREES